VSIGAGSEIKESVIVNTMVQQHAKLSELVIKNAMIGSHTELNGKAVDASFGDYSSISW
jgi:glucose-1-phosphate thymidylyltransferase